MDFNINHPELKAGELFLGNFQCEHIGDICWNTKRRGFQAYNVNGRAIESLRPVFVQQSELPGAMALELQNRGVK
jgi:hypothetical protein